jgi:GNAT superfamily N-acetyltransferase
MTMNKKHTVRFQDGYVPGIIGRIIDIHGCYYNHAWGADSQFEILMARELCSFVEGYRPGFDLLLTAFIGKESVGCIAILGSRKEACIESRLRWFILDPRFHGKGIGKELLVRALRFAKQRYCKCYLWTVTGLPASMHLYEKYGFVPDAYETDRRYGCELKSVRMVLDLTRPLPNDCGE